MRMRSFSLWDHRDFSQVNHLCCSVTQSCPILCNPMDHSTPGFPVSTISQSLLMLLSNESVMLSNHCVLCHPLLLLPSIFPRIRVFSKESVLHIRWSKYWNFHSESVPQINTQDWFPLGWTGLILLAVQGTLKSLLQHHSSKASILQCSAFLIVQLSHPYMITGKTRAFDYMDLYRQSNVSTFFNLL